MKKTLHLFALLFLCIITLPVTSMGQGFKSQYDQLVSVNEQWVNQKDIDPALKNTPAEPLSEQQLISFHLQQTEKLLRSRKAGTIDRKLQNMRLAGLQSLNEYWKKGIFPVNDQHLNRQPYFIDKFNTFCAVGYLMKESGAEKLARMIEATQNYSYLSDISHPDLMNWISKSGFTFDELALIQPGYPGDWPPAIMEMHYNNSGTDVNEYIEVHYGRGITTGHLETILFFSDTAATIPYKTLSISQMGSFYDANGSSAYYYSFPTTESFADSGKIELHGSGNSLIQRTDYNGSKLEVRDYNVWGSLYQTKTYSVGENENTSPNTSLTYCGFYFNPDWSLQSLPSTIGTQNPCIVMPVTLGKFSTQLNNNKVSLSWETFTESGLGEFVIERSSNGSFFESIARVKASGVSNSLKNYSVVDNKPLYINHYRLRLVDKDGKSSFSKMLYVKVPQANPLSLKQNVVSSILMVYTTPTYANNSSLNIYDFSGRQLLSVLCKNEVQSLNVASFAAGKYLLRLQTNEGNTFTQQFIKE